MDGDGVADSVDGCLSGPPGGRACGPAPAAASRPVFAQPAGAAARPGPAAFPPVAIPLLLLGAIPAVAVAFWALRRSRSGP